MSREPQVEPYHEPFLANNVVGHAAGSDNGLYVNFTLLDFAQLPAPKPRDAAGMLCQVAPHVRRAGFVRGRAGQRPSYALGRTSTS